MKTVYNYLNLPSRISDTITPANKIEYVYTSTGTKLKQRLSTGTTLLYFGNYVYALDGTANGIAVKYILTQEGRATNSAGTYTYEYFMKDHLGNTRVSFNVPSSTAVIVQQSDYYPFGMIHQPQPTTTSDNRYLYNGKEFQNNLLGGVNLDLYDYSKRFMDPQIGRFTTIDPASEFGRRWSPYAYTFDNPIRFLDPDGMWPNWPGGFPDPFAGIKSIWYESTTRFKNFISSPAVKDFTTMTTGIISMATLNPVGIIAGATTSGVGLGKFIVDIKPDITSPEKAEQIKNMPNTLTGNTAKGIAEKTGGNAEKAGKIGDAVENLVKLGSGVTDVASGEASTTSIVHAVTLLPETVSSVKEIVKPENKNIENKSKSIEPKKEEERNK